MTKKFGIVGLATGLLLAGSLGASASVIDFTDSSTTTSGTVLGGTVGWSASGADSAGNAVNPTTNNTFDGTLPITNSFGLAFDEDGWGIDDDETAGGPPPETITITFRYAVRIVGFAFLDLFPDETVQNDAGERGIMTVNGNNYFADFNPAEDGRGGYAEFLLTTPVFGTVVTFTAGVTNDNAGSPDGALAALKVAPVPLPAGGLLLLTALGGVAALRRKRKSA